MAKKSTSKTTKPLSSGQLAVIGVALFIGAGVLHTNGADAGGTLFNIAGAAVWVWAIVQYFTNERRKR